MLVAVVILLQDLTWVFSPAGQNEVLTWLMWGVMLVWLAAVGGCLGSFLNVVWHRWGTGRGIVMARSRCDACGHPLRWQHNLPLLGYLLLRGRCYDCGTHFSSQHAWVEAAMASLFVLLGLASPWL